MRLRRSVVLGAWVLLIANLALAFGAIAILTRMAPAIAKILEENDYSVQACEEMLAALAEPAAPGDDRTDRFHVALARADRNVTEASERPVLERIRTLSGRALAGETDALRATIASLRELTAINRTAMVEEDLRAQRMGTAGAWAVVFLAIVSLVASLVFIRRLVRRVLAPMAEVLDTMRAFNQGDVYRRATSPGAPRELRVLMENLNDLLDRVHEDDDEILTRP